jgi:hypothetical protein
MKERIVPGGRDPSPDPVSPARKSPIFTELGGVSVKLVILDQDSPLRAHFEYATRLHV